MSCKICLLSDGTLLSGVCKCKGSMKYIHRHCLESVIEYQKNDICTICRETFNVSTCETYDHTYNEYIDDENAERSMTCMCFLSGLLTSFLGGMYL